MRSYKEVRAKDVGAGGWKCYCCHPAPKHRKQHRRTTRRRLKDDLRKEAHLWLECPKCRRMTGRGQHAVTNAPGEED